MSTSQSRAAASPDDQAVTAERCAAQLLRGDPAGTAEEVARRLLAIQAQDPRGARLAIRARSARLSTSDVDSALTRRRSLVVTWLNRGTLHLVRAEDYWWLHPLTTPQLRTANPRRLAQEGVPPEDAERAVAVVRAALAADGPLTRAQLRGRVAAAGVRTEGQAMVHILALASIRGLIVRGPVAGRDQAFVLARDWLGAPPPAMGREAALGELARRYLAGHAPAADRDLARWAGIGLADARLGLARCGLAFHTPGGPGTGPATLPGRELPGVLACQGRSGWIEIAAARGTDGRLPPRNEGRAAVPELSGVCPTRGNSGQIFVPPAAPDLAEAAVWEDAAMLTVASWNMHKGPASWTHLRSLVIKHAVSVVLVQEAGPPGPLPDGWQTNPRPGERDRWRIAVPRYRIDDRDGSRKETNRWWASAVVSTGGCQVTPREPVELHQVADGGFACSHPGQFAVSDVALAGGGRLIVVSLYGIWDLAAGTPHRYVEATLHRAISDLSVVFQEPEADLILVAGDLNLYTYPVGDALADRSLTVWSRLAAYGLENCGPFRPDDEPRLPRCPCPDSACRHVNTYLNGSNPKNRPYQLDYLLATPSLRERLTGCWADPDPDWVTHSDHRAIFATFDL